jgi:hypothetical protein
MIINKLIDKAIENVEKKGNRTYDSQIIIELRQLTDHQVRELIKDA